MDQITDAHIKAASAKGHSPAAIAKLLGYDLARVLSVLGVNGSENEPATEFPPYTPDALEKIASEALYILACRVHESPHSFKPSEAIAILREALDRTKGKAAQQVNIDARSVVTHEHVMSLPPAEAYRMLMTNAIDVEAGGDTVEHGGGGV